MCIKEDDLIVWLVRYNVNTNLIGWSGATKREKIENIEKLSISNFDDIE